MCLELVKLAKGKASVDYVQSVREPSATDQSILNADLPNTTKKKQGENRENINSYSIKR